ncbi:Acylcarnitine hydrolase, partial [Durusdinium trenchii]
MADELARHSPLQCLGWLCNQLCGVAAERRAASRVLTRAREQCVQLRVGEPSRCAALVHKLAQENNDDLPLQHLRAAEQHLAALERWLRGEGNEESGARAERIARELGLESLGSGPGADEFGRIFSDVAGEILIQSLPGSVKVRNFRHPGKVFITNTRLCFYSYVLGVEVSFAAKWIEIASLRLEENSESHTYPVVVSLKEAMDFDGKDVKMLDLRVFEFSDLGIFQKSAMYFVGADLFGIYEESEVKSPEKSPMEKSVKEVPTSTRLVRTASMISPDEVLKELSMWELERRTNLFKSHWKAPYWPHDGAAKMKWVALEGNAYIRHPFIPVSMAEEKIAVSDIPPVESVEFLGMRRNCTWSTCPVDGETDELGWQYSTDFVMGNTGWLPYCGSVSFVRRRCWQPCFYTDADDDAAAAALDRAPISLIQNKAPATAKETIFEQVLGEISLELLGQSLESDDWKDPDSLMAFYWEETGAMDLDISPWSDGSSFASAVKGKVRTIEMRSPVPPAPMCPKETRVQSTWHIVVLPDQVLLESVTMSLDVPCGTMFNVISCDSFTIKDGKLKMSRTCGVEWLQSSWLKSMVEQNVPPQLKAIAERMVGVVTRWWEK